MAEKYRAIYDSEDEIPETVEDFRSLFVKKGDKWELTGFDGVQTDGNVKRLEASLKKERDEHKATKDKLGVWGDLDHEEVLTKLDRIPELEAASKGKLDEAALDDLATKRAEAIVKSKTSPLERELAKLRKENEDLGGVVTEFRGKEVRRAVHDATRSALRGAKVLTEAEEDALMLAERIMEVTEEGKVVTKDGVGVTPGLDPAAWLVEIQEKRPHWWPPSQGGGAKGSGAGGSGFGSNPWSAEHWNLTEQGRISRTKGHEYAERMAKAAGSSVGATSPKKAKTGA